MAHAQVQCNNPSDSNFSLKDKHIGFPDLASSFPYILHASSKGFEPSTFNVVLNQEKIDKSVQTNLHGMIETFEQNATQYNKTQVKNFEQFTKQNIKNINFKPQTFTHSPKSSYQKSNFKHSFYNINKLNSFHQLTNLLRQNRADFTPNYNSYPFYQSYLNNSFSNQAALSLYKYQLFLAQYISTMYPDTYNQMLKNIQTNMENVKKQKKIQSEVYNKTFYENKLKLLKNLENTTKLGLLYNGSLSRNKLNNLNIKQTDQPLISPSLSDPASYSSNAECRIFCCQ